MLDIRWLDKPDRDGPGAASANQNVSVLPSATLAAAPPAAASEDVTRAGSTAMFSYSGLTVRLTLLKPADALSVSQLRRLGTTTPTPIPTIASRARIRFVPASPPRNLPVGALAPRRVAT